MRAVQEDIMAGAPGQAGFPEPKDLRRIDQRGIAVVQVVVPLGEGEVVVVNGKNNLKENAAVVVRK